MRNSTLVQIILAGLGLFTCSTPSIDLTGAWEGTAQWVVDGEHKEVPLRLELEQNQNAISGAIVWLEYRREITAGKAEGPELRIESTTATDLFKINGLFRNDSIEGRFSIQYSVSVHSCAHFCRR